MRVRIVLGVALALVGAAVVATLSRSDERLAGTNLIPQRTYAVVVPPGRTACQRDTPLVDDGAAAQLLVGTYGHPRPPLTVTFASADGDVVAAGRTPPAPGQGLATARFAGGAVEGARTVRACVRNDGPHEIALGGAVADPASAARVGGAPSGGTIGVRYLRAGRESWWAVAPVVAQRFGLGKASAFGAWTLPLLALALLGLWLAAVRLLLRETDA